MLPRIVLAGSLVFGLLMGTADVRAQSAYRKIKNLAAKQVNNGDVSIAEPSFTVKDGEVSWIEPSVFTDLSPYPASSAIQEQYVVAAIRKTQSKRRQRRFWRQPLADVESLIERELDYIANARPPKASVLDKFEDRRRDVYDAAIEEYARSRGYKVAVKKMARRFTTLRLDPDAPGTIYLITFSNY